MSTPQRTPAPVALSWTFGGFLLIAAGICLAVATLIAAHVFGGDEPAWRDGGLFAFVASFVFR